MKDFLYRRPNWLNPIDRNNITQIAIHHTGAENTIQQDTDYQIDKAPNRFSWLAYGFYIDIDSTIYKVRGIDFENAGVHGENHRTVSVVLRGNFNNRKPSELQLDALEWLITDLKSHCHIQVVDWHKKWSKTSCAGKYFPRERFREDGMIKNNELKKGMAGILVENLQEKLNILGYEVVVDGDFGEETETAVKHFQINNNLEFDGIAGQQTELSINKMCEKIKPAPVDEKEEILRKLQDVIEYIGR